MSDPLIFLSYCHDDAHDAAQLRNDVLDAGFQLWWDQDILPGQDWKFEIRRAMKQSKVVLLCLSEQTQNRNNSGIYPEALDAIARFRELTPGRIYLIPVRLSPCEIPPIEIDATRTLDRLQYVDLFPVDQREKGVERLLASLGAATEFKPRNRKPTPKLEPSKPTSQPGQGKRHDESASISGDPGTAEDAPSVTAGVSMLGGRRHVNCDFILAHGGIIAVPTEAWVIGVFRDVSLRGSALAIDESVDGAISEILRRRVFSSNTGEVFVLPIGRNESLPEFVVLAGLGSFDTFGGSVQELVAENVVRTLTQSKITEFATMLMGAQSGQTPQVCLKHELAGYFRGLIDADRNRRLQRITLCEPDPKQYGLVKEELLRLTNTALFDDVAVNFSELALTDVDTDSVAMGERELPPQPMYLIARHRQANDADELILSLLTAKNTVLTENVAIDLRKLDQLQGSSPFSIHTSAGLGSKLSSIVLGDAIKLAMFAMRDRHLVVVHDRFSSQIPWDALQFEEWTPALEAGISHRYVSEHLSVAKWLEQRRHWPIVCMLLVTNPTLDLVGAEAERRGILDRVGKHPSVRIDELHGQSATREAIVDALTSGIYDVMHYAGNVFYSASSAESGIILADSQVLAGTDLASLGVLPGLVMFDACESGRVRGGRTQGEFLKQNAGLAEAFSKGGVANFIGSSWPVGDAPADAFWGEIYSELVRGTPLGLSFVKGRRSIAELESNDWLAYVHYGSHDFTLKHSVSLWADEANN